MGSLGELFGEFGEDLLMQGVKVGSKKIFKEDNKVISKLKEDIIKENNKQFEEESIYEEEKEEILYKKEEQKSYISPKISNVSISYSEGINLDKTSLRNAIILKEVLDNKRIERRRKRRNSPFRSDRL
ncbi:hypothetical protein [Clostridium sp.]|uniref:hypothetical protein n=1 Tax=Clostridium sp. TaxID=1506 RepID=UPI003464DA48